jgi:hypothetical protein
MVGLVFLVVVLAGVGIGLWRARAAGPATAPAPATSAAAPVVSSAAAPSAAPVSSVPPVRVTVTATAPAPSAPAPVTSTAIVKVYPVTVARTCGASGTGDCYVTERSQPNTSSITLKRWTEGSTLSVVCQVQGQSVSSSVLNRASTVWSRTTGGGYVANIFLDGIDAFAITVPC